MHFIFVVGKSIGSNRKLGNMIGSVIVDRDGSHPFVVLHVLLGMNSNGWKTHSKD